jgi:hypothetical protein
MSWMVQLIMTEILATEVISSKLAEPEPKLALQAPGPRAEEPDGSSTSEIE